MCKNGEALPSDTFSKAVFILGSIIFSIVLVGGHHCSHDSWQNFEGSDSIAHFRRHHFPFGQNLLVTRLMKLSRCSLQLTKWSNAFANSKVKVFGGFKQK